jgi:hypothetical protein
MYQNISDLWFLDVGKINHRESGWKFYGCALRMRCADFPPVTVITDKAGNENPRNAAFENMFL